MGVCFRLCHDLLKPIIQLLPSFKSVLLSAALSHHFGGGSWQTLLRPINLQSPRSELTRSPLLSIQISVILFIRSPPSESRLHQRGNPLPCTASLPLSNTMMTGSNRLKKLCTLTSFSHCASVKKPIPTNTRNKLLLIINIGQKRQGGVEHESQIMEEIHIR